MPAKNLSTRFAKSKKALRTKDVKRKITARVHNEVFRRGLANKKRFRLHHDLGRNLIYYAPIIGLLEEYVGSVKGKKILHLALSTGILTKHLQDKQAIAVGLDIGADGLKIAKHFKNKRLVRADASIQGKKGKLKFLPFKDNSLDCVISDNFLFANYSAIDQNYVEGSMKALADLHRVLKPDGIVILYRAEAFSPFVGKRIAKMGFQNLNNSSVELWGTAYSFTILKKTTIF